MEFHTYANCQGYSIFDALSTIPEFKKKYILKGHNNYIPLNDPTKISPETISKADVILFQPLHGENGAFDTDDIIKYAKKNCKIISFPYIYANWLWPFYIDDSKTITYVYDDLVIRNLKKTHSNNEILNLYDKGEIDFNLEERFKKSMEILYNKEKYTDVKVYDYIITNYKNLQLFNIKNHPTHHIFIYCANQILKLLNIDAIIPDNTYIGVYNDTKYWPIAECVKNKLQLEYYDKDGTNYYRNMLQCILNVNSFDNCKELFRFFENSSNHIYMRERYI